MNAIATTNRQQIADTLRVMQDSLYPGAKAESVQMVLAYCLARGLDPLLKPVHIVPMWVQAERRMRDVPLPGIALYRIQAARSGQYTGKSEPEFGPTMPGDFDGKRVSYPTWCKVTVHRNGHPFSAREYWLENYATAGKDTNMPNAMWAKRPFGQLAKVAEAQALRMAFPELTGGEVTGEEMEGKAHPPEEPEGADRLQRVRLAERVHPRATQLDAVARAQPETAEEEREPWEGMAWPICDRRGGCTDFGDADTWAAEFARRIEAVKAMDDLDVDGKKKLLSQIYHANTTALIDLRRRGYGGEADGVRGLFDDAHLELGPSQPEPELT